MRKRDAVVRVGCDAAGGDRKARVEHRDVALGPGAPERISLMIAAFSCTVPPTRAGDGLREKPKSSGLMR